MTGTNPHRELALWTLERERRSLPQGTPGAAAAVVCAKFYARLTPLVMEAGCQAFLSRSLHRARAEFAFLKHVRAGPTKDTCLLGLDEALDGHDPDTVRRAFVAVITNMIGLLVTFIGEDLAMHVIRDIWPDWEAERPDAGRSTGDRPGGQGERQ